MEFAYFLVAIATTALLCAGLTFLVIDWMLTRVLTRFLNYELSSNLSLVLTLVTCFGVFWVVLINLFYINAG